MQEEKDKIEGPKVERRYKLNFHSANNIRKLYGTGQVSLEELAEQYNVCVSSIRQVVQNQSYRDTRYRPPEVKQQKPFRHL